MDKMNPNYPTSNQVNRNKLAAILAGTGLAFSLNACATPVEAERVSVECTGTQEYTAEQGDALTQALLDNTELPPDLQDSDSLNTLAAAMTIDNYGGDMEYSPSSVDLAVDPMQLSAGDTYIIPTSCEINS